MVRLWSIQLGAETAREKYLAELWRETLRETGRRGLRSRTCKALRRAARHQRCKRRNRKARLQQAELGARKRGRAGQRGITGILLGLMALRAI